MALMEIRHPRINRLVETVSRQFTWLPESQRTIVALMDAYISHYLQDGPDAEPTQEALRLVTSPEMSPALKEYYHRLGPNRGEEMERVYRRLSAAAGEPL
jgi:hypothetical protein